MIDYHKMWDTFYVTLDMAERLGLGTVEIASVLATMLQFEELTRLKEELLENPKP